MSCRQCYSIPRLRTKLKPPPPPRGGMLTTLIGVRVRVALVFVFLHHECDVLQDSHHGQQRMVTTPVEFRVMARFRERG
eukprot:g44458.t1